MWDKSLETGIENIDIEHQYIFSKVNLITSLNRSNKLNLKKIEETLKDLLDYTHVHFEEEERFMIDISYPKYDEHYQCHRSMENIIEQKIYEIEYQPDTFSIKQFISFLNVWWRYHINEQDRKIVEFKKSKH